MIKIKTSDLKEFFRRAKHIRTEKTIGIFSYLKLECIGDKAYMHKANFQAYCKHELPAEFEQPGELLIDELILSSLVDTAATDAITISQKDGKVYLSDGRVTPSFKAATDATFAETPDFGSITDKTTFTREVLDAIAVASTYLSKDNLKAASMVHLNTESTKANVFGTDGYAIYRFELEGNLPEILLSKEACQMMAGKSEILHANVGNHDFFDTGLTLYGFTRTNLGQIRYRQLIDNLVENAKVGFDFDRQALLLFCEQTIRFSISKDKPIITIKQISENKVNLSFEDTATEISNSMDLEVTIDGEFSGFKCNAKVMAQSLRALPYQNLRITFPAEARSLLTSVDDPGYVSVVMGIV